MKSKTNSFRLLALAGTAAIVTLLAPTVHAQTVYVSANDGGFLGAFNASDGTAAAGFALPSINQPQGLTLIGTTLYVLSYGTGSLQKFDATTGAAINTSFITGLSGFESLASAGNTLLRHSLGPVDRLAGTTRGRRSSPVYVSPYLAAFAELLARWV